MLDYAPVYLNRYMTSLSMVFSHRPLCLLAAILLWLPSCETLDRYDITMNDVPVYQAASVVTVSGVEDRALAQCLQQTLNDNQATTFTALTSLNCSHGGITTLAGLEQFTGLESVKLSGNQIRNLLVLERLSALEALWLDDNTIIDPIPVLRMATIRQLNLLGNTTLQCPAPTEIPPRIVITLPEHCGS
ncbi:hypothetical protein N9H10_04360 [Luminiphilus sp.]|nr:hypothetical protein [Luminiphilus sp.]MDA8986284.1 hypothetical protein [Luminiphilus sp.]MDB2643766.1 hypothetical protein [Luminiphilus sp.]